MLAATACRIQPRRALPHSLLRIRDSHDVFDAALSIIYSFNDVIFFLLEVQYVKRCVPFIDAYLGRLSASVLKVPSASALQVLRRLGSIFTSVYAAKLKSVVSLLEGLQGRKKTALCQKE
ncbi:hypothetical protein Tco_1250502 [Tanacetum coccineum]